MAVTLISHLNLHPVNFFVLPENQTAAVSALHVVPKGQYQGCF